jgi:hypothetical protein
MPSLTEHCAETIVVLGKPFEEVHRWLDEFAGQPPYEMRHSKLRHHWQALSRFEKFGVTGLPKRRGCTSWLI